MDGVIDPSTADELERLAGDCVIRQPYFENLALADNSNVTSEGRLRCRVSFTNPENPSQKQSEWVDMVILKGTGPHPLLGWPAANRMGLRLMGDHILVDKSTPPWKIPLLTASEVAQHDDDMQACHSMHVASVAQMRDSFVQDLATNGASVDDGHQDAVFGSGRNSRLNR